MLIRSGHGCDRLSFALTGEKFWHSGLDSAREPPKSLAEAGAKAAMLARECELNRLADRRAELARS
jgi:hypothetical protein